MNRIPELYIAVVDDDPVYHELIPPLLHKIGVPKEHIQTFSSAEAALAHIKDNLVHVVLTDHEMMPGEMTGIELANELHENSVTSHIRTILVTSRPERELKMLLSVSRARHLQKMHLTSDQILHTLRDLFRR